MMEAAQRRVAEYFADDVATVLDGCNVFYTASVGIRGVSRYEHSFDFIFQRSANHPTRFCQAPNKFDKDAVRNIMVGLGGTRKAKERADARLVVIRRRPRRPAAGRGVRSVRKLRSKRDPVFAAGKEGPAGARRIGNEKQGPPQRPRRPLLQLGR